MYDVIIIGAGIIGCSTAFYLKKMQSELNILLLDKNSRVGAGNTGKSAALYRNIFSSKTSRLLTESSIKFYRNIKKQSQLREIGYLWLFSEKKWKQLHQFISELDPKEINFDILKTREIVEIFELNIKPNAFFEEINVGIYGHLCGSLSSSALTKYYSGEFERLGGHISLNTNIIKFNLTEKDTYYAPWADVKIQEIIDQNGNHLKSNTFVSATGAWTHDFLAPIGIASGALPKKRQLFGLRLKNANVIIKNSSFTVPIIILPSGGVYIKPVLEKNAIIVGAANDLGNPFQMIEPEPSAVEDYFRKAIKPVLQHYFPLLKEFQVFTKWAGYYSYSIDNNPVIDQISNLVWASGTSGSGIMKADAIGRIIAAKILGYEKVELCGGSKFNVSDLSMKSRKVDQEGLVI